MPRRSSAWSHALPPAVGIILGVIVGVLLNVATSGGSVSAVVGLIVLALVWAGWEGWHSLRQERTGARAGHRVRLAAGGVDGGRVVGVMGSAHPGSTDVGMTFGTVHDSSVIGVDTTGPEPASSGTTADGPNEHDHQV